MSLPRYGEYKDSGVPWIGQIPAHWDVRQAKRHFFRRKDVNAGMVCENRLALTMAGVLRRSIDDLDGLQSSDYEGYQIFETGDLAFKLIDLQNIKTSRVGMVPERGIMSPAYIRLITQVGMDARFSYWYFMALYWTQVFNGLGGGVRQTLGPEELLAIPVPVPAMREQVAIAAFLDRETAKIDALIAEQEKLLALLAEKRQATISHAVTRGLDPNAPLKDSGIPWLGEVPAHWDVLPIKRVVSSIEQGWSPQCESYPVETAAEWGVLKVGCVNGGLFTASENKKLPDDLEPVPAYSLNAGDLLVSRANTRELVGSAAVVPEHYPNLLLCDKLYRLRVIRTCCDPGFIAAFLGVPVARSQIELVATGASSSMLNIGQSVILELPVPIPPIDEQRTIMRFIADAEERIEQLRLGAQRAIDLLKERRSALIAAAVTGQIDVRGTV